MRGGARIKAGPGNRFATTAFQKQIGREIPLKVAGQYVGYLKVVEVIIGDAGQQAIIDFEFIDEKKGPDL